MLSPIIIIIKINGDSLRVAQIGAVVAGSGLLALYLHYGDLAKAAIVTSGAGEVSHMWLRSIKYGSLGKGE